MKIKFAITLVFLSLNSAFSQEKTIKAGGGEILTEVPSGNGKIVDGYYFCDQFDWKIKIPLNYSISKSKELQEKEAKGNTALKKNLPDGAKLQSRSHLIGFELNPQNTFSASFNSLENVRKISLEEHKQSTLNLLKQSYNQIKNGRFEFQTFDMKIGKYQFYKIKIEGYNASNNKLVLSQIYYNSYIENHLFGALISYSIAAEGTMLEENFLSSFTE